MSTIPYLSQGIGVPIDPATGMPRTTKKRTAARPGVDPSLAANSDALNQQYGLGAYKPFGAGGSTPDYKALIQQALAPFQAQLGAEGVSDLTSRDNQFIRTLGQFGQQFDTASANQAFGEDFFNSAGLGEVLPQANKLAQQTTDAGLSYTARSTKALQDRIRQIKNGLAARGALRSGELGYQLQEAQTGYDTGQYDAAQQVQDFLGAINRGYTEGVRARQAQIAAAQREEAGRQAQLNPAIADRPATWNGETFVYADGTAVPRNLWPTGAGAPPVAPPVAPVMGPDTSAGGAPAIDALELARQLRRGGSGGQRGTLVL